MNLGAVGGVAGAFLIAPVLGLVVLVGGPSPDTAMATAMCATAGPVAGLDAEQAGNARVIVAVTQQVVAAVRPTSVDAAAVMALMTAYQESKLRNLANPAVTGSTAQPGASGSGTDHDSVGLFQQRASWGTVAQRMDPVWATTAFVTRLLVVPGWRAMPPGTAAQAVQGSAFPDAYAQWETAARGWLANIEHRTAPGAKPSNGCGSSGLPAAGTVQPPAGFTLPVGTSPAAAQAVTFALAQLGKPYLYGTAGPGAYDCSGLTMAAWADGGVRLPHFTVAQAQLGTPVAAPFLLRAGDLVFIPGSDGTMQAPGHVGMYLGSGLVIEAPQTGDVVKLVRLSSFGPVAAMRHYG